ncbi:FKBP12-associated protein [Lignoscripta atroalba]|nr:FKBP12-associated protein [Lignoscripta atroalba]
MGTSTGGERGSDAPVNALLALRPASIAPRSQPPSAEPSSTDNSAAENGIPRAPRNRRARDGARGGLHDAHGHAQESVNSAGGDRRRMGDGGNESQLSYRHQTIHGSGRRFGGRLTTDAEANGIQTTISTLQPDAPEFTPGQVHSQRSAQSRRGRAGPAVQHSSQNRIPRLRRGSSLKSTAPDIATRTHEDISNGVYECPICTSEIARNSKIWSCKTCWTVFHLTCIKKWSQNEGSTLAQQRNQNGDLPPARQWRCPGCNLPKDVLPSVYTCWCDKEVDPRSISGIPPHSCGQTCGKHRILPKKCPHPCELLCHAGPCPPCTHIGPVQSCFCGKKSTSRRCVDTNYDTGWSCGEICGDLMPCGEHTCTKSCHEGLCGACEVEVDSRCYCGKDEKAIICFERGDEKESKRASYDDEGRKVFDGWIGSFDCGRLCNRSYDCGHHTCEKQCHPQELEDPHCPRSPDVVSSCPCGKSSLLEISDEPRQSCLDPIPNCKNACSKKLPCGHPCQQICHSGVCMPCLQTVTINCRCGRTTSATICHQGTEEPPQCTRICRVTLNCGRHECGERCCPGERRAAERQATRRKLRPLGAAPRALDEGFEAEHICTRLCGRMLKCGNHPCPELCHKGPCGSCREAIFDEVSCHCGRTVLQPPLPCGTTPPPCRFDCERPKTCGHPQVPHNCHGDQEACPKCPFLTEKPCMCGKTTLKNQQCWLADVRCGSICGRKLKCGSHFCRKLCHRPGECEDAGRSCVQLCGKARKSCGHPCEELCHAPSSCREDKPCQNKMLITCDCQHLKQEIRCSASRSSEGNSKKTLKCDDECARLERNRKLALALNIDPEAHKDDHIPYAASTLQLFQTQESIKWAQTQEREFRVFAANESEKRLRFKPMSAHQRAYLHSLAEDFGLDSESMDPEPHRHVAVFKTPRFVMAPMKTLMECVKIKNEAAKSNTSESMDAQRRMRESNEPFNGFLLTGPRFGLTLEELRVDFSATLDAAPGIAFDISFLPSEEIVLKGRPASSATTISSSSIEAALKGLKPSLASTASTKQLASSIQLCSLDSSLNILRRESVAGVNSDGWSQVAAKAAVGPRNAPRQTPVGTKSVYTVLGSKLRDAKKKKEEKQRERGTAKDVEVVDDWEEEAKKEEERENEAGNAKLEDQVQGPAKTELGVLDDKSETEEPLENMEQQPNDSSPLDGGTHSPDNQPVVPANANADATPSDLDIDPANEEAPTTPSPEPTT